MVEILTASAMFVYSATFANRSRLVCIKVLAQDILRTHEFVEHPRVVDRGTLKRFLQYLNRFAVDCKP